MYLFFCEVFRLEHAFYELAQVYYGNESKRVRTKKDYLSLDKVKHLVRKLYIQYVVPTSDLFFNIVWFTNIFL